MEALKRPPPRRVLVTNDDGPPSPESQFIAVFVRAVAETLGWPLTVCVPAANCSWISKAHLIREQVERSEVTVDGRPWTLLTATPASCVNIAVHHLHPDTPFELVISGPNMGRNSGSNFATSSGTIGAALEAALCGVRGIALSFAYYKGEGYGPEDLARASALACGIIADVWNHWPAEAQVVNINLPLYRDMPATLDVHLTHVHTNRSASLFRTLDTDGRRFAFGPDFTALLADDPTHGSDSWAVHGRAVSVTPLRAAYAETRWPNCPFPVARCAEEAADVEVPVDL